MPIEVVHFHDVMQHWDPVKREWDDPRYVYIGRANARYHLPASIYANPFHISGSNTRRLVLEKYRVHLKTRPHLVEQAKWQLKDKILVCWCRKRGYAIKGDFCHGDILKAIVEDDESA